MEDFFRQDFDVAALLVVIPVVCVLVALGIASLRSRWLNRRRLMKGIRTRPDVIRRDLCRMAEYLGRLPESDAALWRPFEYGLAAMAACQWDQAIEHFRKAQANASGAQLVPIYNQTGVCHYTQGRPDDALRDFEESARLAKQYGDASGKAPALANIGVLRRDRGELGSAFKQLREALAIARKAGDQRAAAACLGCIGNIYLDRGVLDKALKSHEEALAISREIGDNCGVASGLRNLGSIYRDKAEFHKALQQYEEAHAVSREVGDRMGMASCLGSIGSTHPVASRRDLNGRPRCLT